MSLEHTIRYSFKNPELLAEAMTHPSLSRHGMASFNYERLEFLGDTVLALVVADMLLAAYPGEREGALAKRHAALVCGVTLTELADQIGIDKALQMADGEAQSGGRSNAANLENALEALIGAMYLDGGLEAVKPFISAYWTPLLDKMGEPPRDPKTILQEWVQGKGQPLPTYTTIEQSGPSHAPTFTVEVSVEGAPPARGEGKSKREAERNAAAALLMQVGGK